MHTIGKSVTIPIIYHFQNPMTSRCILSNINVNILKLTTSPKSHSSEINSLLETICDKFQNVYINIAQNSSRRHRVLKVIYYRKFYALSNGVHKNYFWLIFSR